MTFAQKMFSFRGRLRRRDFWMCTVILWATNFVTLLVVLVLNGLWAFEFSQARAAGVTPGDQLEVVQRHSVIEVGIFGFLMLATLWPNLAVNVKRLHDRGRSGGTVAVFYLPTFFLFIPVVGQFVYYPAALAVFGYWLVDLGFLDGQARGNQYGPSPKLGETSTHKLEDVFA